MNWSLLLKKGEGITSSQQQRFDEVGITHALCQQVLQEEGLSLLLRFQQVHALCIEVEHGQLALYELYICQEDALSTMTHSHFNALVQIAQAFRAHLHETAQAASLFESMYRKSNDDHTICKEKSSPGGK